MTDPTPSGRHEADERLGAWLDGELSDAQARAIATEIDADPELAARLEAIREVRERLAGSHATEVPDGFTARVQQAVADQSASAEDTPHAPPAPAKPQQGDPGAETASLADARQRRRRRWAAVGSAAAALIAVAVLTPLVGDLTSPGADDVFLSGEDAQSGGMEDSAEAPEALEAEEAEESGEIADSDRESLDAADGDSGDERVEASGAGSVPRVVDEQRAFDTPGALRDHAADQTEAIDELLGVPAHEADDLAERTSDALRRADPFDDGTDPAACLSRVTRQVEGPAVVARVERLTLDGQAVTAHWVVSGSPDGRLDTITFQVRDPDAGCASRLMRRLN